MGSTSSTPGTIKARDLIIESASVKEVRVFVEENHYSKSINGVKISQCFKVLYNDTLVGGVIFGQLSTTAWRRFSDNEGDVLELRRLVLLDAAGRNSESRVIGACLRWIKKNTPDIRTVVSYADPMFGHSGVIYKASNFRHDGMTPQDTGFRDIETGKIYHSRAMRTKYKGEFKPFVKRLREKLESGLLEKVTLQGKHRYVYSL